MTYLPYGHPTFGEGGFGFGQFGGSTAPTFLQLRQALAIRLDDITNQFWTDAENGLYIIEALRMWNVLTGYWKTDFPFQTSNGVVWYSVPKLINSPRVRTVTDADIYTMMEYHLLEPPTGAVWTGTPQFSIAGLSAALLRRRDETLQFGNCNLSDDTQSALPNQRRFYLPDNVLEVRRARYVPDPAQDTHPVTLWREDGMSFQYFESRYLQTIRKPRSYAIVSAPPLAFDVNDSPSIPGTYDLLTLQTGPVFSPPAATPLGIPDDFSWIPKWGALGDLLAAESEANDPLRAAYCQQRYQDGLKLIAALPWMVLGQINGIAVDTPSVIEMDAFAPEWDSNPSAPAAVVTAGMDFIGISPVPPAGLGVVLTLIANAPVPSVDTDTVQASPDVLDAILDAAQHLAALKQGGSEFTDTIPLFKNFVLAAMATNSRLSELGLFLDVLNEQGQRQLEMQPRFAGTNGG